jgi:hypothetical protein
MAKHITSFEHKMHLGDLQTKVLVGQQKDVQKELDEFMNGVENKDAVVYDVKQSLDASLFICITILFARPIRLQRQSNDVDNNREYKERNYNNERSYNGSSYAFDNNRNNHNRNYERRRH